jgi:glycosyltransferase involved in cell wall biosynthesis
MTSRPFENPETPTVSVIIPAFKTTQYITQALDSVLAQTFRDHEIIVVNDGCPDTPELERVLLPYMSRIVYVKQPNGGLSAARNTGIRNSRAPIIALLDSDDYWHADFLTVQVGALAENPAADAVYPNAFLLNDPSVAGKTYMDVYPSSGEVTFLSLVNRTCVVMGPGMTFHRSILDRAGLYDPELRIVEDLDLWLRMVKMGGRIIYHHRPVYYLRYREDRLSRRSLDMLEGVERVLEKNAKLFPLSTDEQAALDRVRKNLTAQLQLSRGKKAFFEGDVPSAIRNLTLANAHFRRWKLRFALTMMKIAPGLLRTLGRFRMG